VPTFLERLRRDPARVRLERLERLQALTEELSAAQTRDEVFRVVLEHGSPVVEATAGALYREGAPGELELVHSTGFAAYPEEAAGRFRRVLADDPNPIAEAYRTGRPLWVTADDLRARYPELAAFGPQVAHRSWAALPWVAAGTRGVVAVAFGDRRAFDDEERNFILAAARQCTNAAERARLFDASNRFADRLRQILSVATTLSTAATPREVAAGAFRALGALGARAAEIHGLDGDRVALLARHGRRSEVDAGAVPVDAPTPAAEVVRTGRAIWLESPEEIAQRYPQLERERVAKEERAWAVVPLLASGHTVGALVVTFSDPRRLEPDDRTYVRLVAQPCAQALERARLFDDAARARAEGPPDAALFTAACAGAPIAVAVLDRELRFVRVNDAFAAADGLSPDAHVGRTPADVLQGAAREPIVAAFHEVIATGRPVDVAVEREPPDAAGVPRFAATLFPVRAQGEIAAVGLLLRSRT
jgi:PAS domain S-box-containing protein